MQHHDHQQGTGHIKKISIVWNAVQPQKGIRNSTQRYTKKLNKKRKGEVRIGVQITTRVKEKKRNIDILSASGIHINSKAHRRHWVVLEATR